MSAHECPHYAEDDKIFVIADILFEQYLKVMINFVEFIKIIRGL